MDQAPQAKSRTARLFSVLFSEALLLVFSFLAGGIFALDLFDYGYSVAACFVLLSVLFSSLCAVILAFVNLKNRNVLWAIAPIVGYGVAAAFGFSLYMIPVWVITVGGAELLYFLFWKKTARLPLVASFSALCTVCVLAVLFLHARARFGAFDVQVILQFIQTRVGDFVRTVYELAAEFGMTEGALALGSAEDVVRAISTSAVLSLPGLFLCPLVFIAYSMSTVLRLLTKKSGALQILYGEDGFLPMPTVVTGIVYLISLVATNLLYAALPTVAAAAASNLCTVLQLVFAFVGLAFLVRPRRERRKANLVTALISVVAIAVYVCVSGAALTFLLLGVSMLVTFGIPVLSYIGLAVSLFTYFRSRRKAS
ncbi:MAG: hypothetical protein IKT43_05220 [Clostridia bacterium]|nr:hypothetical protein [Clostridia bacterium]